MGRKFVPPWRFAHVVRAFIIGVEFGTVPILAVIDVGVLVDAVVAVIVYG